MSDKIIIQKLSSSMARFNEMYIEYKNIDSSMKPTIKDSIQESLIQRFEYVVETMWKTLKKYLEVDRGLLIENSPKKVFRTAASLDILDGNNWILFVDLRIKTSHDYSGEKSNDVFLHIDLFHTEANSLLKYLEVETSK